MRTLAVSMLVAGFMLAGCNNAKSPDAVAKDVSSAEQKASTDVAKSEDQASKDLAKAADKVDDRLVDFNNVAAKDAYNLAMTNADGDHKVATAKCNALSGDAQKACKDQADADYNAAKAEAKATATAQKQ